MKRLLTLMLAVIVMLSSVVVTAADDSRNPLNWLKMESFDTSSDSTKLLDIPSTATGTMDGYSKKVNYPLYGWWATYKNFSFTGEECTVEMLLGVSTSNTTAENYPYIEIRKGTDPYDSNNIIATVYATGCAGMDNYVSYKAELNTMLTGVENISVTVRNKTNDVVRYVNIYSLRFLPATSLELVAPSVEITDFDAQCGLLELRFNNTVDEDAVAENVTLFDENGTEVTTYYRAEGKKLYVIFGTLAYNSNYTLTIGDGLKSKNGYYCEPQNLNILTATEEYSGTSPFAFLYSDCKTADVDNDGIKILFNRPLDTVTKEMISLKCGDRDVPVTTAIIDEQNIVVTPKEYIQYGEEYSLDIKEVKSINGETVTQSIVFIKDSISTDYTLYDANGIETDNMSLADKIEVATIGVAVIGLFDQNGRFIKLSGDNALDGLLQYDWSKISIFVIDSTNGYIEPLLAKPIEIVK